MIVAKDARARIVVITGARGFIGRALMADLHRRHVCVIAPGWDGHPPDIATALTLRPAAVVALTSASPLADQDAQEAFTIGHVLPLIAATEGHCRLVAMGSAAEYGTTLHQTARLCEDHPRRPVSPYGIAKARLMDELRAAHDRGADVLGLRLFSAAGPGMSRLSLWGSIEAQLRAGKTHIVTGPLDTARDILPIRDAAAIIASLALAPGRLPATINLGCGQAVPLRPLVRAVLDNHATDLSLAETRPATADPAANAAFAADIAVLRRYCPWVGPRSLNDLARKIAKDTPDAA